MSTAMTADVVFVIDTSGSMNPIINAVKTNIGSFVDGLAAGGQMKWNVRYDFIAQSYDSSSQLYLESLNYSGKKLIDTLQAAQSGKFFTNSADEFSQGLSRVQIIFDEIGLIALDVALDFPWRPSTDCHRVVVFISDEPFEGGGFIDEQLAQIEKLMEKVEKRRVILFIIAPESDAYYKLSRINKSEYTPEANVGALDFSQVLESIGKSISVAGKQTSADDKSLRDLYGLTSGKYDFC
jgi:uncharacterized protein YegL